VIIVARPPNWDQIVAAFPQAATRKGVLFAHGEDIYNPSDVYVTQALHVHEAKHCARQFQRADAWWDRYIADPEFRYEEELLGHAEELKVHMSTLRDRNARYRALSSVAFRLVSDLYNYVPRRSYKQAMAQLSNLI
jgi:hypothetical protein